MFSVAPKYNEYVICDTGTSNTHFKPKHNQYLTNCKQLQHKVVASLPNNAKIAASYEGVFNLHPKLQVKSLIFPELHNESLLSVGQVCDQDCTAIFNKKEMKIVKDNQTLFKGYRDYSDGLWKLNMNELKLNYIVRKDTNKSGLARYLHAYAFSPVISTLETCVKKSNFITWPGVDKLNFKKLLQNLEATLK